MPYAAFLIIGLFCGHAWPADIGFAVAGGAVLCIAASWYADHSPDEVYDLLTDYCEALIWRAFLPWAAGALGGALWLAFG